MRQNLRKIIPIGLGLCLGVALVGGLALVAYGALGGSTATQAAGPNQPGPNQPGPNQPGPNQPGQPTPVQPGPGGPNPTPQPPAPTPNVPTPPPASSVCTHTNSDPTWFEQQASHFSWAVYCAVLPSGWNLANATSMSNLGGSIMVNYQKAGGASFHLEEGHICGSSGTGCTAKGSHLGSVKFGDQNGEMYDLGSGIIDVWVGLGSGTIFYHAESYNVSAMQMSDLVNAMHRVS